MHIMGQDQRSLDCARDEGFVGELRSEIMAKGPLDIGRFMALAVEHYYSTRDPFGEKGDFTTAPEISQMFGEMIGAWAAQIWIDMEKPKRVTLLELGPGRGTLMADLLRGTAKVEGFHAALDIALLEISPVLRERQKAILTGHPVRWVESLEAVDNPVIVIANEFLDALPVRHLQYNGEWQERAVGFEGGGLGFTHKPALPELLALMPKDLPRPKAGDILELSPARLSFMGEVFALLKQATGAALFIDYGYTRPAYGETLQALYRHEYCPVLDHAGEADMTAHVDFRAIEQAADVNVFGPLTQAQFLLNLGIDHRARALQKASPRHTEDIEKALRRLTHSDEMGTLFKVIGYSYGLTPRLAGFGP